MPLGGPGVSESDAAPLSSPEPEELLLVGSAAPSSLSPSLDELSYLGAEWEAYAEPPLWTQPGVLRGGKWLSPFYRCGH